jgi:hypothetical protein
MLCGIRAAAMARPPRIRTPAIAYLRTSSAANVGADKGSDRRQRDAIATYAKHAGLAVVDTYYDAAVQRPSGPAPHVDQRQDAELLGDELAGKPAGVLDQHRSHAVPLDAIEQRKKPWPRLDRIRAARRQ